MGGGVKRRLWLFDLVWTIMFYGVEVWGWRKRKATESAEKVRKVGSRIRVGVARVHDKGRTKVRKIKIENGKKSLEFRKKIESG